MKKNELIDVSNKKKCIEKLLLIMKLTFFLTVINILAATASGFSQAAKLSINLKGATLKEVFSQIETQSDLSFLYKTEVVNPNEKVDIQTSGASIQEVLDHLFFNKKIQYEILDNSVIVLLPTTETRQQKTITGKITDASTGEPIIGANIIIEGTTIGTTTDLDGNFALELNKTDIILVVSYIGYNTERIQYAGQTNLSVQLVPDITKLDEVVVVGYGTVKKKDLTGAVGSVQGEIIADRKASQISQALQGAMSGVMVTRDNNAPGSTASIKIRGVTTIGNTSPLIIVDGVPADDINQINPNDVENISVLKDAASASIYGSRAAAGVILITTKRAQTNQIGLDYSFEYGIEKPTTMSDYVDVVRYMQMTNELRWNDNTKGGEYQTYAKDVIENYSTLNKENPDKYPNTDWMDLMLKDNSTRQSHRLSLTGGNKTIRSKATFAYDQTGGLYEGKDYKRLTARINNDININKSLSASVDFYAKRSISESPSMDPIYVSRISAPVYAAVWSNGLIADGKSGANIYGQIKEGGFKDYWYNQVGGKASLDFSPIDGLKFSAIIAPEFNYTKGKEFLKRVPYTNYSNPAVFVSTLQWASTTNLKEVRNENYHVTTQLLANYSKSFGNHNLNLMAGNENYNSFAEDLSSSTDQMELSTYPYLDLNNDAQLSSSGTAYEIRYTSFFGRVMYNFKNKYYLQGNVRYDASSRFNSDYRWGSFPSFSAGWVLSEESFMKNVPVISFLKLRGSWGRLGNERMDDKYPYLPRISFGSTLFYQGSTIVSSTTAAQTRYAIRDISWETTESFDFGGDISLFNNKLRFTGDYYKKVTKDMLLELEIPDYMGYDNPQQNTGRMNTTGWEFEIGWKDQLGDFGYSVSANLSDSKSKIGDLGGIEYLGDQVKFDGSEFNEWYGYKSSGIFQTEEEVKSSPKTDVTNKPGDIKYLDISGPNGEPDGAINAYDKTLLGGSLPRYTYGGNIQLDYKNWDFSMAFQGVGKQNVRYTNMMVQPLLENWGSIPSIIDGNYWSNYNTAEQNLAVKYPRLSYTSAGNNYAMSDFWMFNGRYFRLKNITLGYTVPKSITDKIRIQGIRVYGSVSDLFSLNKYPKGWDPEVSGSGYPITTSFVFGATVKF